MFLLPKSYVLPEEAFVLPDAIFNLVKMTSVFVKRSSWWLKSRQNVHLFRVRADSSRGPLSAINYRLDFPPHRITHEDRLSIQGKAEHCKKNIQRMLTWASPAYKCVCVASLSGFSLFQETSRSCATLRAADLGLSGQDAFRGRTFSHFPASLFFASGAQLELDTYSYSTFTG